MQLFIQKIWYQKSLLRFFLWPFSIFFAFLLFIRKILYRIGLFKTTYFNCPVIVVGNVTIGGTGKTPLIVTLAHFFQLQGYRPVIISRGYGGHVTSPQSVTPESDPRIVGDEAVLLARRAHCPVVVFSRRVESIRFLQKKMQCDVILSDDGLQHLSLGRAIEIAVVDGHLGFGNGFLLPAGPLREPVNRLKTVNFCVINGIPSSFLEKKLLKLKLLEKSFKMELLVEGCANLKTYEYRNITPELVTKKWHAVAGIGSPERFFRMLKELNFSFTSHPFPDHYQFSRKDFCFLEKDECVMMTEKDAVKCESFADERYWYIPVSVKLSEDFFAALLSQVQKMVHTNNENKIPSANSN